MQSYYNFVNNEIVVKFAIPSLVSILTTLLFYRVKRSDDLASIFQKDAAEQLHHIREESKQLKREVVTHLRGAFCTGNAKSASQFAAASKKSRDTIMPMFDEVFVRIEDLRLYLPECHCKDLELRFHDWKSELTKDPFPIQIKSLVQVSGSHRLSVIEEKHRSFDTHVVSLRRECLLHRIICDSQTKPSK